MPAGGGCGGRGAPDGPRHAGSAAAVRSSAEAAGAIEMRVKFDFKEPGSKSLSESLMKSETAGIKSLALLPDNVYPER